MPPDLWHQGPKGQQRYLPPGEAAALLWNEGVPPDRSNTTFGMVPERWKKGETTRITWGRGDTLVLRVLVGGQGSGETGHDALFFESRFYALI